jgi:hypothetical protein
VLHDFDKTLEKLLIQEGKLNPNEIEIAFDQPTGEWSARLSRPTLNCWCYDIRENVKLRSMERRVAGDGKIGRISVPPRRIDVSYLVTAWARKVEDEHQLLWRALSVLKRHTSLAPGECEGDLRYQSHDIPLTVADMSDQAVNIVDLWSVLNNQMRLGFLVIATVELDTQMAVEAPLVLEGSIRFGQANDPTQEVITHLSRVGKIRAKKSSEEES